MDVDNQVKCIMKNRSLMIWLCVALSACGSKLSNTRPSDPPPESETWFKCKVDTDCRIILDPTCTFISINSAYEIEVRNWIESERARPGGCFARDVQYEAICSIDRCSSRRVSQ